MKIHAAVPQGSLEWAKLRVGKVTASELHNVLTLDCEPRKGEGVNTYLAAKAAERYRGTFEHAKGSWSTEQGHYREDEAIPWFELEHDADVRRVGFVEFDDSYGCSPDGLIGDDGGIEVKCPEPTAHVKYLLGGKVPNDYWLQVQGSLYATGRKWWKFLSYHVDFPKLLITVERDEELMKKIAAGLALFNARLTDAHAKITQLEATT